MRYLESRRNLSDRMIRDPMASYDFSAPRLYLNHAIHAGIGLPLDKAQQNYLLNVLRLSEGKAVLIFNGRDGEWRAELAQTGRRQMSLVPREMVRPQLPLGDLHYLFAPLKHARLDYMVQKAVEMGASSLRPVLTRRTQSVRLNIARIRANVIEAAEQCGILALPDVHESRPLDEALAGWSADRLLVFCDEDAAGTSIAAFETPRTRSAPMAVLVGPEGGFSPEERRAVLSVPGVIRLSLGPRILRADTAAVAALSLVQAFCGDWRRS